MRKIILATDGACLQNPGRGGWAWITEAGDSGSGGERNTTNNAMELRAILEALIAHPAPIVLHIQSDSMYSIDCVTKWHLSWARANWCKRDGSEVKNRGLIERIVAELKDRDVTFEHVRGHRGHVLNEAADKLAGLAARACGR